MNKIIATTLLLFSMLAHGEENVAWPDLSAIKYVSQRPATEADINEGAAVFILQSEGINIGNPMSMDIPQYAIHTDGETGEKSNVVVIQAEEANGQQVIGAVIVGSNEFMAGLANEFKLLVRLSPIYSMQLTWPFKIALSALDSQQVARVCVGR